MLNHRTAAQTPLTLLYWTACAFSSQACVARDTSLTFSSGQWRQASLLCLYLSKDVWSNRIGQRALVIKHTIGTHVGGSLRVATPTTIPFRYFNAYARARFDSH